MPISAKYSAVIVSRIISQLSEVLCACLLFGITKESALLNAEFWSSCYADCGYRKSLMYHMHGPPLKIIDEQTRMEKVTHI